VAADHEELQMTTTAEPARVITDREIGAAELQVAVNQVRGVPTPQWILDLANFKLDRTKLVIPPTAA